ncbi:hypothetical protein GCM10012284_03990 [Mangrovihabitans endophyticus]|uniref:Secreted protein n=2 Tax=Mangrovihabitans endophyticus TaxID=1751298 RepID=A0A8J3FKX3_9ACTN|nr:hypothetical protein GCM10012284_03990 [Mangrovihabitans endophyticus]
MTRGRALLAAFGAGLVAAGMVSATPAQAAPVPAELAPPLCAWGAQVSADGLNILYPDDSASYWILPYRVRRNLSIVLSGSFPDSRFASVSVYQANGDVVAGDGASSTLTDFQITPDAGSVNPWQQPAPSGGAFTVTLSAGSAAPGAANALPLAAEGAPDGALGFVIYRVYRPAGGPAAVPLPAVTFHWGAGTVRIPTCAQHDQRLGAAVAALAAAVPAVPAGDSAFARTATPSRFFPNTDSGYLSASVTPPREPGTVVVVRGKAPTTSTGDHPSVWPSPGTDVRYTSLCTNLSGPTHPVVVNHLPGGGVDYGCRHDDRTELDAAGYYTYVLGTEAQRSRIERIPGATFVPFSTADPARQHVVLLRHMLASDAFPEAVQNVPADGDPSSAAAVMGLYYPRTATCPLSAVATGDIEACPVLAGEATENG